MGVCGPNMNSCTPKCKLCTGPNAGSVYDCANPCECYPNYGTSGYVFQNGDCVPPGGPCWPYATGSNCPGTLQVAVGAIIRNKNTGSAKTTDAISDSYTLVANGGNYPGYTWNLSFTANDPKYPPQVSWQWYLGGNFSPQYPVGNMSNMSISPGAYGSTTFNNSLRWFIRFADGSGSPSLEGEQAVGEPDCIGDEIYQSVCCGCQPCSIYWGCPGTSRADPVPADPASLYGNMKIYIDKMIVRYKWLSGPNQNPNWTTLSDYTAPVTETPQ